MSLVLDANLSPHLVQLLTLAGHDTVHVGEIGLLTSSDTEILQRCEIEGRILVTADIDFPMLMALRPASSPSVVLFRGVAEPAPSAHSALLIEKLPSVSEELDRGAIVTITPTRVRVRDLPIQ